jgi:hypothetical protein
MTVDKINVSGDPRVQFRQARVNGKQYGMHLVTTARVRIFHSMADGLWAASQS